MEPNPHFDRLDFDRLAAAAGDGPAGQQARSGGAEAQASEGLTGKQAGANYWSTKSVIVYVQFGDEA